MSDGKRCMVRRCWLFYPNAVGRCRKGKQRLLIAMALDVRGRASHIYWRSGFMPFGCWVYLPQTISANLKVSERIYGHVLIACSWKNSWEINKHHIIITWHSNRYNNCCINLGVLARSELTVTVLERFQ